MKRKQNFYKMREMKKLTGEENHVLPTWFGFISYWRYEEIVKTFVIITYHYIIATCYIIIWDSPSRKIDTFCVCSKLEKMCQSLVCQSLACQFLTAISRFFGLKIDEIRWKNLVRVFLIYWGVMNHSLW